MSFLLKLVEKSLDRKLESWKLENWAQLVLLLSSLQWWASCFPFRALVVSLRKWGCSWSVVQRSWNFTDNKRSPKMTGNRERIWHRVHFFLFFFCQIRILTNKSTFCHHYYFIKERIIVTPFINVTDWWKQHCELALSLSWHVWTQWDDLRGFLFQFS